MRKRLRIGAPGDGDDRSIAFSGVGQESGPGRPPPLLSMRSLQPVTSSTTTAMANPLSTLARGRSDLLATHKRNFDQLEKRIATGDLEWCSIEVMMNSSHRRLGNNEEDGVRTGSITSPPIFATVLEYPSLNEYNAGGGVGGNEDEINMVGSTSHRKKASVMIRSKSRKLLKRLSSRSRRTVGKSAGEQQQQQRPDGCISSFLDVRGYHLRKRDVCAHDHSQAYPSRYDPLIKHLHSFRIKLESL